MDRSTQSTATQTSGPPDNIKPYLNQALGASQTLYEGGGPQYYPGQTVTPFSSQTQQALDLTQQRALAGSPLVRSAQGFSTNTLNGNYLPGGANGNPYLDRTFNMAAQATRSALDSQFAGSGRNLSASYAPRADQLNNLATQIYGGAYDAERNRQLATLPQALPLANQDYADIGQLQTVGANYEDLATRQNQDAAARYDYSQNRPEINLNNYLSRILGQPGVTSTTTTPLYRNQIASGLGGAALGSQIGGSIGNGYPGLGAILGGLLGAYGG